MAGITKPERVRKKLFDLVMDKSVDPSLQIRAAQVYLQTTKDVSWNRESKTNVDRMVKALEQTIEK